MVTAITIAYCLISDGHVYKGTTSQEMRNSSNLFISET